MIHLSDSFSLLISRLSHVQALLVRLLHMFNYLYNFNFLKDEILKEETTTMAMKGTTNSEMQRKIAPYAYECVIIIF